MMQLCLTYKKILSVIIGVLMLAFFIFVPYMAIFRKQKVVGLKSELDFKVPNIVHYIWYADKRIEFKFQQYLSILSVHKFQKPTVIYYHTNNQPKGPYWENTLNIPELKVIQRDLPQKIFDVKMAKAKFETSDSDIDRVKVLLEYGGIYLDTDVWVINSLDPLRRFEFTMGAEISNTLLGGSIILANKDSAFLKLWMEHFLFDYKVDKWAYNSGKVPTRLSKQYPELIHIEEKKMLHPSWQELDYLYGKKSYKWKNNYTIHLWRMMKSKDTLTPELMKSLNSTYGQAARYIYNN